MFGVVPAFDEARPGAFITGIVPDSLAQKMGFFVGDAVMVINRILINELESFANVDASASTFEVVYQSSQDAKLHRRTARVIREMKVEGGNTVEILNVIDIKEE